MLPTPTIWIGNDGEFNDGIDVVDFPANEAEDLPFKPVVTPPEAEDFPLINSQPEAPSLTNYSSRGQLLKISQQMHESIDQGLTLPTLLGYAAKA